MNLSDEQQLRLTVLCSGLADDTLTSSEREELNALLHESEEARRFYIRHAMLCSSLTDYAAELQTEAPAPVRRPLPRIVAWLATAAVLLIVGIVFVHRDSPEPVIAEETTTPAKQTVAAVSGTQDCEWTTNAMQPGAPLQAGQRVELKKGFAEITFDSGAQVTLEGPASLVVSSPWDASLERGTADACVPDEAEGFRLSHDTVELVNSGAELSMTADESGTEVLVHRGSVAASSHATTAPVVLRENESRRFNASGTAMVADLDRKLVRFTRVLKLERMVASGGYAHWAFDDTSNASFSAETKGKKRVAYLARMMANETTAAATSLTDGRWERALNFDGRFFAKASAPNFASADHATTLAFWVRVPDNASLASGSSMIAWGDRKHGAQHSRVAWNKKPELGVVGALRTEIGRKVVTGSISLRDGRWHHIAVVLTPEINGSLQAKQYVDGRLDGSSSGAMIAKTKSSADADDTLFLGRTSNDKNREGFFVGALDELFVIDRALSPGEITRLMKENQPPDTGLASAL